MAYRADLLAQAPRRWEDLMSLARQGKVAVPLRVPHTLMMLWTLAANLGHPCATSRDAPFLDPAFGPRVVAMIAELAAPLDPGDFERDPIAISEILGAGDGKRAVMPYGYGYVSYAREGFRPPQLTFADIPVAGSQGPIGSALGGTGLAISKHAANKEAAIDYAYWVMSADVQRGPYAGSGGQPGHAVAWEDPAGNAATGNFYRNARATLEGAYVRPRHGGLHRIQEQGGRRLNDGLLAGEQPDAIVSALNRLFKESFR